MKNSLLIIGIVSCIMATQTIAQTTFVGGDPEPRNIVIEEFSGIYCGYCPDGADRVKNVQNAHPGKVVAIKFHSSNLYSNPSSSSHPDLRSRAGFGYAIAKLCGVTGYPQGAVNRDPTANPMAISRSAWETESDEIINSGEMSPVNLGIKTAWNASKRELTVTVQTFYTDNSQAATPYNLLNVAVIESDIVGYQSDYGSHGTWTDYHHNETFRDMLTGNPGVWDDSTDTQKVFEIEPATHGDQITKTSMGNLTEFKYTYMVSPDFNIENMEVAAYVYQGDLAKIFTGLVVPAKGATGHSGNFEAAPAPGKEAVGIDENAAFTGVSVYPNPVRNVAYINFSTNRNSNVNVEVFNLIGEKVANPFNGTISAGSKQIQFNTESLKSGIYFVNIRSGNSVETLKLNVTH